MPQKPTVSVSSVSSQRDNRYLDTFYDLHRWPALEKFASGRPWWGYRERAANKGDRDGFVGGDLTPGRHIEPGEDRRDVWDAGWIAPWMPEGRFFDFDYQRSRITIRYDKIIRESKAIFDQYYDAAAKLAFEKSREVEYGSLPPYAIRVIIGEPPPSPRIAEAAQAGDPWLLGFTSEVNEVLAALLGLSVRGLTLASAARPPLATPEAVLASSPAELQAMIAEAVTAALAARDTANRTKMAKVRAARRPRGTAA